MKKTLAIILSAAMVLSMMVGMFVFTASAAGAESAATDITVTPATGDAVVLNAENTTFNGTTGTAVFDAATGTLTLTNLTGVKKFNTTSGNLNVVVNGTNQLDNGSANNCIYTNPGHITVGGTGTLEMNGAAYILCSQNGDVVIKDSVTVSITATGAAIHSAAAGKNGKIVLKDSVKVTVDSKGAGIYASGVDVGVYIQDSAEYTCLGTGDAIQVLTGTAPVEGMSNKGTVEISGNAVVKATQCNCGIRNATNNTPAGPVDLVVTFKDNAKVDMTGRGQGFYLNGVGNNVTAGDSTLTIQDNADVKWTWKNEADGAVAYSPLDIRVAKGTAAINMTGGALEVSSPKDSSNVAVTLTAPEGKTALILSGDDAASAVTVTEYNMAAKYSKITFVAAGSETPGTETPTDVKVDNPAAEVVITKADGTTVALNKDNKTTDGATYDPATGKLTIEGLNAKKITVASGDVIVEVKGTNTLTDDSAIAESAAADAEKNTANGTIRVQNGDLFFVGNGKLTVTAVGFNIYVDKGAVTFTDEVKVELEKTGDAAFTAAIYLPLTLLSDDGQVVFSGKANVKATAPKGGAVVRVNAYTYGYGKIVLKDEAVVDLSVTETKTNWSSCAFANKWEVSGGTLTAVTDMGTLQSGSAIAAYADGKNCEDRYATFTMTGGTLNLKTSSGHATGRPHGLFTNYAKEISITGGTLNLDVSTPAAAPGASGEICIQWNGADYQSDTPVKVEIGGTAEINAKDGNSDGLFGVSNQKTHAAIVISGGKITGTDNAFIYDRVGKSTLEIKGGEIDWTSKTFNVKGATATATVNFKEGGVTPADTVIKTGTNPGTSDLAVALVSVIAVTSVVAAAAVLFVRKRRYN